MQAAKRAAKKERQKAQVLTSSQDRGDMEEDLLTHFRDEEDEKRVKLWRALNEKPSKRGGAARLLKAQAKRAKQEAVERHKVKRGHKEDRKHGSFKSNSKYKRR